MPQQTTAPRMQHTLGSGAVMQFYRDACGQVRCPQLDNQIVTVLDMEAIQHAYRGVFGYLPMDEYVEVGS